MLTRILEYLEDQMRKDDGFLPSRGYAKTSEQQCIAGAVAAIGAIFSFFSKSPFPHQSRFPDAPSSNWLKYLVLSQEKSVRIRSGV